MLGVTVFNFLLKAILFPGEVIFVTGGKFRRNWFEPWSNIPGLKMIIRVTGVLRRTVFGSWRFDNPCRSHLHYQDFEDEDCFHTGCRNVSRQDWRFVILIITFNQGRYVSVYLFFYVGVKLVKQISLSRSAHQKQNLWTPPREALEPIVCRIRFVQNVSIALLSFQACR